MMTNEAEPGTQRCWVKKPWLRRLGAGAFFFFLIKGLLWLIVPAVLAWTATR
ncbi:MAG: hypothetical protein IT435_16500 [Phycisphaerales bacterium]|nr:hypothetical protein [Phycisphaerales bacterium]